MTVTTVDPRTSPEWARLSGGPDGSLFTSPPWIAAVCETYGFTPSARLAHDDRGRPVAGLAWVDVDDLRGVRRISLPFGDRADPILPVQDRLDRWTEISKGVVPDDRPFTLRRLVDAAPADERLRQVQEVAWHRTSLDGGAAPLHGRVRSSVRRNIATAARSGVQVDLDDGPDAVVAFHRLHARLRKHKYRMLAQPLAFFEAIHRRFAPAGAVRTGIARIDGEPIAAAMYLEWAGTLYYKFGASDPDRLALRPNDALHWAAIEHACARGLRAFDWGISDLDQPGLVAYKRKWASEESRVITLRGGMPPEDHGTSAALTELTRVLVAPHTPDGMTRAGGDVLYRLFC